MHAVSVDWFLSGLEWILNFELCLLKLLIFYQKLLWNTRSRLSSSTFWVFEPVFTYVWSKSSFFVQKASILIKQTGWITLWPEWHFGQRHFGRDTLAGMTLWPEWPFGQRHFGQRHFGQRDTLASDTLARVTLWPEWHFGQSDSLARVTLWPETLWPEWHFGQFFLLPLGYQRVNKNLGAQHRQEVRYAGAAAPRHTIRRARCPDVSREVY